VALRNRIGVLRELALDAERSEIGAVATESGGSPSLCACFLTAWPSRPRRSARRGINSQ
jgi:hypothetical protein